MPRLIARQEPVDSDFRYAYSVQTLVQACEAAGHTIDARTARLAWEAHSEASCATWLLLPEDPSEIVSVILQYCDTVE